MKYDLESNSYFFIKEEKEVCHLRLSSFDIENDEYEMEEEEEIRLVVESIKKVEDTIDKF